MNKVAIVYWSGTGNTEMMAEAIAEGVIANGAEADLIQAADFSAVRAAEYDGIAFGCPAMGAEELEWDEFGPMFEAVRGRLRGKKLALFGSYGWGDGEWMRNWQQDAEGSGLMLVADGLIIKEAPDDEGLEKCRELGAKLV